MGKRSREKKERRLQNKETIALEKPEEGLEFYFKKIIFWGTVCILFTPLIISSKFFFPFVGPKSLYFMALAEIIFLAWIFLIIFYPKYRPRFNIILLNLILFIVIAILASIFGIDLTYSFWSKFERMTGILMMLHLLAFFLIISSTFQKKEFFKIFLVSILVGAILSLIAFFSKEPSTRGGATIGNDSFLGTYLLFNLFLSIYLFFKTEGALKLFSAVCFSIMALQIILSQARAARLSFLGGLVLLFFLYLAFGSQKRNWQFLGKILLILSFLTFSISYFLLFQENSFIQKIFIKYVGKARLVVWQNAWQSFLERPILGWGPENFEIIFPKKFHPCLFLSECGAEVWFDRAHNIIFDTLVSTGIIGFLAYCLIFLSLFYILWKNYFKQKIDFFTSGVFSALLAAYFVQNLTVFDMVSSYMMFFLVLGFIAFLFSKEYSLNYDYFKNLNQNDYKNKKISFSKKLVCVFIFILFTLSFNKFVIQPAKTDFYTIKSIQAQSPKERVLLYQKTLSASPVGKYQIREYFANLTSTFITSEKASNFPKQDLLQEIDFVAKELEKSVKESPLNYRSWLVLGQTYNVYSLFDSSKQILAEEVLKKAMELSPTNPQTYWALAQNKLYQSNFEEAISLAEKSIELEKRLPRSHLIAIQVAKISGNLELATQKAKEALEILPELEPEIKKILEK